MTRAVLALASLCSLLALAPTAFAEEAQAPQALVGLWACRTDDSLIRVELRADGRYVRAVRIDNDVDNDAGTWRLRGAVIELRPTDAEAEDIERFRFRLLDANTLEVTDEDDDTYRLLRQGAAPAPTPQPQPGPQPEPQPKPQPTPAPGMGGMGMGLFPPGAAVSVTIVNIANDFVAYYEQCREADATQRAAQWAALLEAKHPDFFDQVIYRKKEGAERERFKQWCISTFWSDVAPKMPAIRTLNAAMPAQIGAVVASFQKQFPDFKPSTAFYITVSFTFRGKVVDLNGKGVFGIGLDQLDPQQPKQIELTIAHELFHLYHFQAFSASGALYRTLWAEGLAAYASSVVVPGQRMSACLGFPAEKMNRCQELLPTMAAELKGKMGDNDERLRRIYFGAEANDAQIPPEAGYYVGLLIVQTLAKKQTLAELARLEPKAVYPLVERELARLAAGE